MIQDNIIYNPKKDIKPVNPEGWLDLKKAFVNGVVPGDLDFDDDAFNGIEDPSIIGDSPREAFQAMRLKTAAAKKVAAKADTPQGGEQ